MQPWPHGSSTTHGLLLSEATGLWDAESIIFNRGRSVALWTFMGRVFHDAQRPVERGHPPSILLKEGCLQNVRNF